MSSPDIQRLREIKTFPSLVTYLRDELGWPIESDDFDDLTFDYEPEELGIDPKTAAKIDTIKQLRPLTRNQPWGIFFIKFEPKRLPVVALRRILSQLVIKKRTSIRKADQPSWHLHDLLFISNYGEGDQRQITFAQFSGNGNTNEIPTLKVLGWDKDDTALHIDDVHATLKEKLCWHEEYEKEPDKWRQQWSSAFTLRHREVIDTSAKLAELLAQLAQRIYIRAIQALTIETERGPLRQLHKAFQTALIHDLSENDFADMYAQTIAYGLLAARVERPEITSASLADAVPITNPFLKEMLGTFLTIGGRKKKIDFDELGIQDVVDLLNDPNTHMKAILHDFGNRTRQEDPVIHFYESFLALYDKKKKVKRGVFYTPQPVVSYIVRSVHELLKTEFGLEDGLASTVTWGEMVKRNSEIKIPEGVSPDEPFVLILDIATGTATFLVEVIEVIYNTMLAKWKKEGCLELQFQKLWNEYVPKHLLPRLYGYELMMAPYAIAHMKIGLKLSETGYKFGSNERAHIYLTNSLEPPTDLAEQPQFEEMAPALAHEAKAVNAVKRKKRFTVVIGNPPYSYMSANLGIEHRRIVEPYKFVDGQRIRERGALQFELNIQDDYVKFLRLSEITVSNAGHGIVGFVTNNAFLANITFRGMRQHLWETFSSLWLLNLHGSLKAGTKIGEYLRDENVFDIQQGVSISMLLKQDSRDKKSVRYGDLKGTRQVKYDYLMDTKLSALVQELTPHSSEYLFVPRDESLATEYENGRPLLRSSAC